MSNERPYSDVIDDPEASMKLTHFLALIGVGIVALVGFDQYRTRMADRPEAPVVQAAQARAPAGDPPWGASRVAPGTSNLPVAAAATFQCDGRTHCSQMTSCAEAEYFLRNCPNTKMDGNNDGEPCEQQWCN
ncbi:excalibur calcium-binding domain-containing protein [Luteimonas sp. A611]